MDKYELLVCADRQYNTTWTDSYKFARLVLLKNNLVVAEVDLEKIFEAWEWLKSDE